MNPCSFCRKGLSKYMIVLSGDGCADGHKTGVKG